MKNKTEVLEAANKAVQNVDSKLLELDELTNKADKLDGEITELTNAEKVLLASEKSEEAKLKEILRLRASVDIKSANLAKVRNEIAATQDELRALGTRADLFIGALYDAVLVSRRNRASDHLKALFIPAVQLELSRFVQYSFLVNELENGIGRLSWFPAAQVERNVAEARKVRAVFDALKALV